jgi:hypothetical protein
VFLQQFAHHYWLQLHTFRLFLGEISSGISISASADASTQSAKLTYQYEYGGNTTSKPFTPIEFKLISCCEKPKV